MSCNRLSFDRVNYSQIVKENNKMSSYMLYPGKFYNKNECRNDLGLVGGAGVSLFNGNLVNLESDLRGQSMALGYRYKPRCNNCRKCSDGLPCGCLHCQEEMNNLPSCQMFSYRRVALPSKRKQYYCKQPY